MSHQPAVAPDFLVRDAAVRIFERISGRSLVEPAPVAQDVIKAVSAKPSTEATLHPDVLERLRSNLSSHVAPVAVASPRRRFLDRLSDRISPARMQQFKTVLRWSAYGLAGWFAIVALLIVAYRFINPPFSNLMLYHYLTGRPVAHQWVALNDVSPAVIRAVVTAEDAQFCRHWGIDFAAIKYAIENANGRTPRGASTISMQTAKNMFLWQSKSYVRKALEVPVTLMMEFIWPKTRMLEIYLNIAEWGPGVFGIGAAARHHFKTTPKNLGQTAAAQLAAALPNPKVRRAGRPGPKTRRKARVIRGRAQNAGYYTACLRR